MNQEYEKLAKKLQDAIEDGDTENAHCSADSALIEIALSTTLTCQRITE